MTINNSINAPNTLNEILVGNGNSFTQIAPSSTTAYIMTSNGPSSMPSFQAATTTYGVLEYLETQVASSSAELVLTAFSTYPSYLVLLEGLVPNTAGDILGMQISDDGGTSYASSNYQSALNYNPINTNTVTNLNSTSYVPIANSLSTSSSVCGYFYIYNIGAALPFFMTGKSNWIDNASSTKYFGLQGAYNSLTSVDALRFYMSSGNIASGSIYLYGLKQ